ncbi:MAG: signal peptidase I [Candidatus Aenigmarchaeota archaeon]|nr:signal peptidase I [Candidatus Aenigmarchaeota archaeon]
MSHSFKQFGKDLFEVLVAVLVAFLLYQGLALVTGTPAPIVTVVSESMVHANHFDAWWEHAGRNSFQLKKDVYAELGITKEQFLHFPFANGLYIGDLIIITGPQNVRVGDVVTYVKEGSGITIIHRVVAVQDTAYIFRGDNNPVSDNPVPKDRVVGKARFVIPLLGFPRLLLFKFGI